MGRVAAITMAHREESAISRKRAGLSKPIDLEYSPGTAVAGSYWTPPVYFREASQILETAH
jgi:hypothetical protein